MIFRILQGAILLFWGVMAFFLIRQLYFPQYALAARVPSGEVLNLLLDPETPNHVMQVYQGRREVGHLNITLGRHPERPGTFWMRLSGAIYKGSAEESRRQQAIRLRYLTLDFTDAGHMESVGMEIAASDAFPHLEMNWNEADGRGPQLSINDIPLTVGAKGGTAPTGMDPTKLLTQSMLQELGLQDELGKLMGKQENEVPVNHEWVAGETRLYAAGQWRNVYELSLELTPGKYLRLYLSRQGELIRGELMEFLELRSPQWYPAT